MRRVWWMVVLGLLLTLAGGPVWAQGEPGAKAYAPEDLNRLSVRDQVRVLQKEYSDLSRGRSLPDDQLEFYLDQIRESGWTFSMIRQDMIESIQRLESGGTWRPLPPPPVAPPPVLPPPPPMVLEVECASRNRRYTECPVPWRFGAELRRQTSSAICARERTWGWRPGVIWVSDGCRGIFVEARGQPLPPPPPPPGWGSTQQIQCSSVEGMYQECRFPGGSGAVRLVRQLSSTACIEGRNWGWRPGVVWVNGGCRGLFEAQTGAVGVAPGPRYEVQCSSDGERFRSCRWDFGWGNPVLVREFSDRRCFEGTTWGWDSRGIWVDRGCSALFSPGY